jgi:hypothetical protein
MPSSSSSYCSTMMKLFVGVRWRVRITCTKFHLTEENVLFSVVEVREDPTFPYALLSFWRGNGRNDKANRQIKIGDEGKEAKVLV